MRNKRFITVFSVILVSMLLFAAVSIFSLTSMARENTVEINTMLAYRLYDELFGILNEPIIVTNTMSDNTLLIDFLKNENNYTEEEAVSIMQNYLERIRSEFGYDAANVISESSRRYYSNDGLNKIIDTENDAHDIWYKNFVDKNEKYIINVDVDEMSQNQWTAFVDVRIEDTDGTLLGVCSVGLRMSQIQSIFSEAQDEFNVKINLVDKNGLVQVDTDAVNIEKAYLDIPVLDSEEVSENEEYIGRLAGHNSFSVVKYIEILDWYLVVKNDSSGINEQFTGTIALNIIMCVIILAAVLSIIVMVYRRSEKKDKIAERLGKQLSSTADIYISLHEIDFVTDTFIEVMNNRSEASQMIGDTKNNCQETILGIMTEISDTSTRESILDFVDFSKLDERLKDRNTITSEFKSADGKWRRARYIVSGRLPDGRVSNAMYLIEDIDAEKRDRENMYDTAKLLSTQLGCVANIYTSVHDVDIINDSFTIIKMNDSVVQTAIGNDVHNAHLVLREAMKKLTDESCLKEVLEFTDFANVKKNLAEADTATVEFINSRGRWCRGRFIVAERTESGELSHIIWAVENIDTEKRVRDKLAETARELNYRISSIADIYLTAHEFDLETDKFIEMKSDSRLVNEIMTESHDHARDTFRMIMESVTDESCLDRVLTFIDMDTLEKRLRGRNTIETEYLNKEKKWRRGRFVASRRDNCGRLTHVMWLTEDIDAEKQQRDKLVDMSERAVAANEAKSTFLSTLSKEIMTPIQALIDTNEVISRDSRDGHILECSEKIRRDGNELLGMINNILDYSAAEAGKLEINLSDYAPKTVINELTDMIKPEADEKDLSFVTDIKNTLPDILCGDGVRIKQIMAGLLANAVKYTDKGMVTLSVGCEPISDEPDSVLLKVCIMDTGKGMRPEQFERWLSGTSEQFDRTTVGIRVTQKLLRLMDSELEAESVYELGTKFSFEIKQTLVRN